MANPAPIAPLCRLITAANHRYIAAFNRNDAAGIADCFTEDGQLLPAYGGFITGREAICAFWQGAFDMGIALAERVASEIEGSDRLAYDVGTYVLRTRAGRLLDRGTYVRVWKRKGDEWQCYMDIWHSRLLI